MAFKAVSAFRLPALLVIAGAGSGKTNTLAHRVAHLIVNGADPRRILLMTFSRRAATEMARRVERIMPALFWRAFRRHEQMLSPGPARFMALGHGSCANTPARLGLSPTLRSMTGKMPPTS